MSTPDAVAYPPEPWDLRGQLHSAVFLVPLADLPLDAPEGWTPVRLGRLAVVGTAWVTYEPGGVLSYRELMATVLLRRGRVIAPHIVRIWVDSPESLAGGRALWGIPKELAHFDLAGTRFAADDEKGAIATGTVRPLLTLPVRVPVSFQVVQRLAGATKPSPVRSRARPSLTRTSLDAAADGPLGFLAGRRALVGVTLRDFRMSFGG